VALRDGIRIFANGDSDYGHRWRAQRTSEGEELGEVRCGERIPNPVGAMYELASAEVTGSRSEGYADAEPRKAGTKGDAAKRAAAAARTTRSTARGSDEEDAPPPAAIETTRSSTVVDVLSGTVRGRWRDESSRGSERARRRSSEESGCGSRIGCDPGGAEEEEEVGDG